MKKYKIPSRLKVALGAFWAIMKERPHAFCDEKHRSVLGDHSEVSYFQANIADLYRQSVETQIWMRDVDKILKKEI